MLVLVCPWLLQVSPRISPWGGFLFVSGSFELLLKPCTFGSPRATRLKLLPACAALVSPEGRLRVGKIILEKREIISTYK